MNKLVSVMGMTFVSLILTGCGSCSSKLEGDTSYLEVGADNSNFEEYSEEKLTSDVSSIKIAFTEIDGNVITIPVKINGMGLNMIYDTGASTTLITLAEAKYLFEKGKLTNDDFIGIEQFQSADGSIHEGLRIIIRKLEIGDKICLHNVEATVVENQQAPLLLGQSAIKQFREISVDRENKIVKFFE